MQTQPIDFHPPTEDAAPFLLPVPASLFSERADRFESLARNHSLGDWLAFLGRLTRAQHEVLKGLPDLPLPDADQLALAREHRMPPLNAQSLARPAAWRFALQQLCLRLQDDAPEGAQLVLKALFSSSEEQLEKLADGLLGGELDMDSAAQLPFVGAALQLVFTKLASQLDTSHLQTQDAHNVCPCCGSPAVASIVRLGAAINNLRYLHCSLCNTEWNVPRAVCTSCGSDKEVALHELEGSKGEVRAETCDACKGYLKVVYQEKDPRVDPVADDLATLALDLLVDEAGYERTGPNLLLIGAHSA